MRAKIRSLPGAMAALAHLVLHSVHFLHWGFTGVANSWFTGVKIWQVGVHEHKNSIFCLAINMALSKTCINRCSALASGSKSLFSCPIESDAFC